MYVTKLSFYSYTFCFPGGAVVKNLPASAGDARDVGLIPESGRSPGEGNGNPHQYSCLGNSMNRGSWQATVHRVAKSQMWLSTHRIAACDYAKQCGGLKQQYVNYHNFMGSLGTSHSRCLTLSFKDVTGLAVQAGALTWADAEASCWREMSWGLWLQHLCAAFQETWLSFLTAWQLVSERECLRVSFLRDPSGGFFISWDLLIS